MPPDEPPTTDSVHAVADRVFDAAVATFDLLSIAIGDRLGYYRYLAKHISMSVHELATAAGTAERYTREWLEQQAATGLLETDPESSPQTFRLAAGVQTVLADPYNLNYLAPLARQLAAAARQLPAIAEGARTGAGVPWADYGTDMRESEAELNAPGFLQLLADDWIAALPRIRQRLLAEPPATVADVGCGAGWSAIGLAQGYPLIHVDGYELDAASVELARRHVTDADLADRIHVHHQDIAEADADGTYDLVMVFEALHDLAQPITALAAMRRMLKPTGSVLIADMKVADEFTAPADDVERLMYGFSLFVCLPDSMSQPGSALTGTVMRAPTMYAYARQAGFTQVRIVPIEHDVWRFYQLDVGP